MTVKHKTVYRVENRETGEGPYSKYKCGMSYDLPDPKIDTKLRGVDISRSHYFGCTTKKMLREWIDDPDKVTSLGNVVRKYEVPVDKVVASQIQCIFKKKDAQCVAEYDIAEFMKGKKK